MNLLKLYLEPPLQSLSLLEKIYSVRCSYGRICVEKASPKLFGSVKALSVFLYLKQNEFMHISPKEDVFKKQITLHVFALCGIILHARTVVEIITVQKVLYLLCM